MDKMEEIVFNRLANLMNLNEIADIDAKWPELYT